MLPSTPPTPPPALGTHLYTTLAIHPPTPPPAPAPGGLGACCDGRCMSPDPRIDVALQRARPWLGALQEKCGVSSVVDVATLTGACMVALGAQIAGLFTPSDAMAASVTAAAKAAGALRLQAAQALRAPRMCNSAPGPAADPRQRSTSSGLHLCV